MNSKRNEKYEQTQSYTCTDTQDKSKVQVINAHSIWHAKQRAIYEFGFSQNSLKIIAINGKST